MMSNLPPKVKNYTGQIIGVSTIESFLRLEDAGNNKKRAVWRCVCKCGKYHNKYSGKLAASIRKGLPNTCGDRICSSGLEINQIFDRLTVTGFIRKKKKKSTYYLVQCICICGNKVECLPSRLNSQANRSCGCMKVEYQKSFVKKHTKHGIHGTIEYLMYHGAKSRAKKHKLPFSIEYEDIVVPDRCPVLGIKIRKSNDGFVKPSSPTLDKLNPLKGYTKNNIVVMSHRANTIKSDGRLSEFESILKYMQKNIKL